MLYFGRYLLYFLALNFVLNLVYRISPVLGIMLFIGFIYFSLKNSFRFTRFRTNPVPPPAQRTTTFKKDPNVIDAEYKEHKTN